MVNFEFTSEEARKLYESKIANLKKIADFSTVDSKYLWHETVTRYAAKVEKVKAILQSEGINALMADQMFKKVDSFLQRCASPEFHIALIGTIKAGKSTLINALLGHEYASTEVTPETAALTKFKKGANNYVKLSFYSNDEWNELWKSAQDSNASVFLEEYAALNAELKKNEWLGHQDKIIDCESEDDLKNAIKEWTSSKSECHYFVKEVEVGLKDFELPDGVILVDTPGLDDVVVYRSNITKNYIDRANAVLVCVKSDALTGPELATIFSVFSNVGNKPDKVYIIATQTDTLNMPKKDWEKQKLEWIKYLEKEQTYKSRELAEKNIIPVSAYLYTLLKISKNDERYCTLRSILLKLQIEDINKNRQEILEFTHIEYLKNRIQNDIIQNYKRELLEDIVERYELCRDSIKETISKIKDSQEKVIEISQGKIEDIKKQQKEYDKQYQEAEEGKILIDDMIKLLKKNTAQLAEELAKDIRNLSK